MMRSRSGSRPFLEIAIGFVKTSNEQRLLVSEVKHHGNRAMAGCLYHGFSKTVVVVKIVFDVTEFMPLKQVLQCTAIATKVSGVDQEIRVCQCCVFENHGF